MKKITQYLAATFVGSALLFAATGHAQVLDSKPADWPKNFVWHKYDKTAPAPASKGKVKATPHRDGGVSIVPFNTLPLQHAIVRVRGDGSRKLAIVVDPMCPYSRRLEKEINKIDNVTIYSFMVPTLSDDKNSKNWKYSEAVMCQEGNQLKAQMYDNWFINGVEPTAAPAKCGAVQGVRSAFAGVRNEQGNLYMHRSPHIFYGHIDVAASGAVPKDIVERILSVDP